MAKIPRARLNVMPTEKRLQKLRAVALSREKSMTQMIEDWIDRLPDPTEAQHEGSIPTVTD